MHLLNQAALTRKLPDFATYLNMKAINYRQEMVTLKSSAWPLSEASRPKDTNKGGFRYCPSKTEKGHQSFIPEVQRML